jgi:hypothetical protein
VLADFLAGLVAGTGLGILIDPRLRAYIADIEWRSGNDIGPMTTQLLERLREPDPRDSHESLSEEEHTAEHDAP